MNNIPKLRFPEFTDAWEKCKLGSIAKRVKGNDGDMSLPTLTISAGSGWLSQKERFSGNIAGTEQKNYTLLKKGQLSYNHGNSKLAKYGAVFALKTYEKALVPRVYHSFEMNKNGYADFIEVLFATKLPDRELVKKITSGARTDGLLNISFEEFMDINIKLPTLPEQQKIGNLFKQLDRLITLHKRKWDDVILLKKALLQKMFPKNGSDFPEIRFPEFTDAWEKCKLGEIATINPKSTLPQTFNYVDLESVVGTEMRSYKIEKLYSAPSRAQRLAKYGDIFYQTVRPYQKNNYLFELDDENYVFSTGYAQIRSKIYPYFLFTLIQNDRFVNEVLDNCTGTSYPAINAIDLKNITIFISNNPIEQQKIGNLFKQLDRLITLHK